MPKKQTKKKEFVCTFPGCVATFEQSNYLTNHKKFCEFNPDNIKKMETLEQVKEELQNIKTDPNLTEEEREKLDIVEQRIINNQQKEKEIAEKSQTRRDKKEDLDILKLDEQIAKHEEKSSGPDSIDKLLSRRERVAIIKSLEQPPAQPQQQTQQLLQTERDRHNFEMKMLEKLHAIETDKKTGKSDIKNELKNSLDIAKQMGFSKSDESASERMLGETLTNLMPIADKWLSMQKGKSQDQQAMKEEFEKQHPQHQPAQMPEEVPTHSHNEVGGSNPPSPAPVQPAVPEPSNQELMQMNYLRDESYPSLEADNDFISQSLNQGEFKQFAPTTTA